MGKRKKVDVYLEVRKRRGHIFLNETSACVYDLEIQVLVWDRHKHHSSAEKVLKSLSYS